MCSIPGALGEGTEELKTRAYADDTAVVVQDIVASAPIIEAAFARFGRTQKCATALFIVCVIAHFASGLMV